MADVRGTRYVRTDLPRWMAGAAATVMGWTANVPSGVRDLVVVLTVFVALDTLTGVLVARVFRAVASPVMRKRLVSKLAGYTLLIAMACGAALMSHQWAIVGAGVAACIGIEATSMLENLSLLEKHGGLNLGPAKPLLARLSRYLVVMQAEGDPCKICPAKGRRGEGNAEAMGADAAEKRDRQVDTHQGAVRSDHRG